MPAFKHTVKFVLQQSKISTKETPLRCFVRYNNTRSVFPSGEVIEPRYWNVKNQEPRHVAGFRAGPQIQRNLKNVKASIATAFDYLTDKNKEYPDPEVLKELAVEIIKNDGSLPGENKKVTYNFFNYIDKLISDSKTGKRLILKGPNKGNKYSSGTIRAYNSAYGVLKRFIAFKNVKPLQFDDINLDFYYDLKEFAYNVETLSDNYFGAVVKFIKTCLNEAKEEKLHSNDEHTSKRFIKVQVDVENVYLDESQLIKLAELDLSENKKLERVRDLFLVGCWTGLRFSDFTNIQQKNIQGDFIEIKTQKTGEMVAIPIHSTIKEIMTRYKGITPNSLPPAISNVKLNEYIKDVAKETGFSDLISLEKAIAGKKVIITLPLNELITTHTARRAFASNMFKMGIPTIVIMAVTGHTTEKAFLKYIKVTPKEKAEIMREIWNRRAMKVVNSEITEGA